MVKKIRRLLSRLKRWFPAALEGTNNDETDKSWVAKVKISSIDSTVTTLRDGEAIFQLWPQKSDLPEKEVEIKLLISDGAWFSAMRSIILPDKRCFILLPILTGESWPGYSERIPDILKVAEEVLNK